MPAEHVPETIDEAIQTLSLDHLIQVKSETPFTHVSRFGAMKEAFETSVENGYIYDYERMELLGDAILSMLVTLTVRDMFPLATVGTATVMHHALVSNKTLAKLAKHYKLTDKLIASLGQLEDLQDNYKIQAAMFEAYVCALHDEHGIEGARKFIRATYAPLATAEYHRLRKQALGRPAVMRTSKKANGTILIEKPDFSKSTSRPNFGTTSSSPTDSQTNDDGPTLSSAEDAKGDPIENSAGQDYETIIDEHSAAPPGNYVAKLIDAKRLGLYENAEFKDGETFGISHQIQHETILVLYTKDGTQSITAWGSKKQESRNRAAYQACKLFKIIS